MRPRIPRTRKLALAVTLLLVAAGATGVALARTGAFGFGDENLPPDKAALAAHEAQVRAAAAARAAEHPKPNPAAARPAPQAQAAPPTGIVDVSAPFPASEYLLGDKGWQDVAGNTRTTVYVGALGSDRSQGVVIVATATQPPASAAPNFSDEATPGQKFDVDVYRTPANDGAVEITAARGTVLTLRTASGKTLTFDVGSRRFG